MGGHTSKRYRSLSDSEKLLKSASKLISHTNNRIVAKLFSCRVYAPTKDAVKASARFEVRKLDEGKLRNLKRQFVANNSEGDRVVLRCRDGTVAPHQEILRSAWSGFLEGDSAFRIDFSEYALHDIRNLVWYIYTNNLPSEQEDILSVLTVAHRLGYTALSTAAARRLVDLCAEFELANVHVLIQHARRFELKSLYDRLCVVLARNFQHKPLMHSLDADILKDVLSQNCLAVFSEDDVCQFVREFADKRGGHVPLSLARCVRAKYLESPVEADVAQRPMHDSSVEARSSFRAFFINVLAAFRCRNSTLTVRFTIELKYPDGKTKKLCVLKQHYNNLQAAKSNFELPVSLVSCKSQYFAQLDKYVVEIDPFSHKCCVVCNDVVKLDASESLQRVEVLTSHRQRITLSVGPSATLKAFRIRTPCHTVDLSFAYEVIELDEGRGASPSFSSLIQLNEKLSTDQVF